MTGVGYGPDRARQLRLLLWVVVGLAALMALLSALLLLTADAVASTVLLVLVLPALALLGMGAWSLRLLGRDRASARTTIVVTAVVAVVVGLLLSRTGAGLLVGVVGIVLLLVAVLPGRDADRLPE